MFTGSPEEVITTTPTSPSPRNYTASLIYLTYSTVTGFPTSSLETTKFSSGDEDNVPQNVRGSSHSIELDGGDDEEADVVDTAKEPEIDSGECPIEVFNKDRLTCRLPSKMSSIDDEERRNR